MTCCIIIFFHGLDVGWDWPGLFYSNFDKWKFWSFIWNLTYSVNIETRNRGIWCFPDKVWLTAVESWSTFRLADCRILGRIILSGMEDLCFYGIVESRAKGTCKRTCDTFSIGSEDSIGYSFVKNSVMKLSHITAATNTSCIDGSWSCNR